MKLKREILWPIALITIVFLASGRSKFAAPDVGFSYDKIVHFSVFGLIATSVLRIPFFMRKGWKGVFVTILLVSFYGIFDEFRQSFTAGRTVDSKDWIADTSGAIFASVIYFKWSWYRKTLEMRFYDSNSNDITGKKQLV